MFAGCTGLLLAMAAGMFAVPIIVEYFKSGLVARLPIAMLCTGPVICVPLSLIRGLILNSIAD